MGNVGLNICVTCMLLLSEVNLRTTKQLAIMNLVTLLNKAKTALWLKDILFTLMRTIAGPSLFGLYSSGEKSKAKGCSQRTSHN